MNAKSNILNVKTPSMHTVHVSFCNVFCPHKSPNLFYISSEDMLVQGVIQRAHHAVNISSTHLLMDRIIHTLKLFSYICTGSDSEADDRQKPVKKQLKLGADSALPKQLLIASIHHVKRVLLKYNFLLYYGRITIYEEF